MTKTPAWLYEYLENYAFDVMNGECQDSPDEVAEHLTRYWGPNTIDTESEAGQ